jgi:hypothetical protein
MAVSGAQDPIYLADAMARAVAEVERKSALAASTVAAK